jgi:hypothetical protein
MTQYHFLDEAGDAGLGGKAGSSKYFALAMTQLVERCPLNELVVVRQKFHFPPTFEFKYHKTTPAHKEAFFEAIQLLPFRVRAVVVKKDLLGGRFAQMEGADFMVELTAQLIGSSGLNGIIVQTPSEYASESCRSFDSRKRSDSAI